MGNRAVIQFEGEELGIYLHWNGGPESIEAFLTATKERVGKVDLVGMVQTIANFLDYDGLTLYVDNVQILDQNNGDNGLYLIADGEVVGRLYVPERCKGDKFREDYRDSVLAQCQTYCTALKEVRTARKEELEREFEARKREIEAGLDPDGIYKDTATNSAGGKI